MKYIKKYQGLIKICHPVYNECSICGDKDIYKDGICKHCYDSLDSIKPELIEIINQE